MRCFATHSCCSVCQRGMVGERREGVVKNDAQNSQMKNAPFGFTLIELLVVISIIAILISILLPALATSRRVSIRIKCMAQIRQLGLGLTMYTNDHDDYLPRNMSADPVGIRVWTNSPRPSPVGLGILFDGSYFSTGEVLYCPAARREISYVNQFVPKWGIAELNGTYNAAWWGKYDPGTPDGVPAGGRIAGAPVDRITDMNVLVSDVFTYQFWRTHYLEFNDDGFNVLYSDGHARWIKDDDRLIYDGAETAAWPFGSMGSPNVIRTWERFNEE